MTVNSPAQMVTRLLSLTHTEEYKGQSLDYREFSRSELECLLGIGTVRHLPAEEPLTDDHDGSTEIYFLMEGQVEVLVPIADDWVKRAVLGPGSVLGEVAFLDMGSRTARVLTASPCTVVAITREDFLEFSAKHPSVAVRLLWQLGGILGSRLRRLDLIDATEVAREQELKALAQELHDETMSDLTALSMELSLLGRVSQLDEAAQADLSETRGRLVATNLRLREIVRGIYPAELVNLGLVAAFTSYLDNRMSRTVAGLTPLRIELKTEGFGSQRLPEVIEIDLYRMLQQAVTNIIQHSQASEVKIDLRWLQSELRFEVVDDGRGFDQKRSHDNMNRTHFGLANMKDRVERHQGLLEITSQVGTGTSLIGWMPTVNREEVPTDSSAATFTMKADEG